MSTILEALATYADAQTSLTSDTNLFGGRMPDSPDTCVCLYEYEGQGPSYVMGSTVIDLPRIQVICRAAAGQSSYSTARDQAQTLRALFDVANTTLSGITVLRVTPLGSVNGLGVDEKDRHRVAVSFECEVIR